MRKTKIICTIGPASEELGILKEMLKKGMNVARLNFSHGSHEEHQKRLVSIRQASLETGIPVAVMLDTKGPEIRIGLLEGGSVRLEEGKQLVLTTEDVLGTPERIGVSYAGLPRDVKEGDRILLDDGLISLRVQRVKGAEISCVVENGGEISDRKRINIPQVNVNLPGLSAKDYADIIFGVQEGVDFIAASYIRSAADVLAIRKILEELQSDIQIISKIENRQGVNNIDEIIQVSDGIMVARGDLGVEFPAEEVPVVQKMLIQKCNLAGKPVITATQMLDSMTRNPRPTRAEASDVANAIYDGSDAIMLSGETASGKYPVLAVETMSRIACRAEESLSLSERNKDRVGPAAGSTTEAISFATCSIAINLGASAVITATKSGSTARFVSKYRPKTPIVAVTPDECVCRRLLLVWGVYPLLGTDHKSTDGMISSAIDTALEANLIKDGDLVVITAGVPSGIPGTTNLIKVHTAGKVLARGTGIGRGSVSGRVLVAGTGAEALERINQGDILVTTATDRDFVPALEKAVALITEEGGLTSHGAIAGLELGIPVIVGVERATTVLSQEQVVTVNPASGIIYRGNARTL
ncbi:MAG: pyruvate kinase [Peptococcaceae bacterium]|jgi:pyruvate kinase|nr:pyruvate kinase [Peptococcaceae bacterium]MDH7525406.1 pyruvate kinase [Peptococcaceae bacterium]